MMLYKNTFFMCICFSNEVKFIEVKSLDYMYVSLLIKLLILSEIPIASHLMNNLISIKSVVKNSRYEYELWQNILKGTLKFKLNLSNKEIHFQ